jgi:hypothetical protein
MRLLCGLTGHEPASAEVYNGGYFFSHCRRCGGDMLRSGDRWGTAPAGHRVVWKSGRHSHSVEPDYERVRPILHPTANLPMARPRFSSWSRQMVGRPAIGPAAPADEPQESPYPRLLVAVAMVAGALQLLFRFRRRGLL